MQINQSDNIHDEDFPKKLDKYFLDEIDIKKDDGTVERYKYEVQINQSDNIHDEAFSKKLDKYFLDEIVIKKYYGTVEIYKLNEDKIENDKIIKKIYKLNEDKIDKDKIVKKIYKSVKKYKRFPEILTEDEYKKIIPESQCDYISTQSAIVGLDYTECKPCEVDFKSTKVFAIYGKKEFGKTNLLRLLLKNMLSDRSWHFVFLDDGRNQLKKYFSDVLPKDERNFYVDSYQGTNMKDKKTTTIVNMKLSPMQLFMKHIHEYYMDLTTVRRVDKLVTNEIFGSGISTESFVSNNIRKRTIFVLQSKFLYVNSPSSKVFMEIVLPSLAARAEENEWIFIFSDVKNINDSDNRDNFNSCIETAFLLDSIAEFVSERGQKSVFGNMDVKSLKEEYARCEKGDGYIYSVEKDELKKIKFKFIKEKEE